MDSETHGPAYWVTSLQAEAVASSVIDLLADALPDSGSGFRFRPQQRVVLRIGNEEHDLALLDVYPPIESEHDFSLTLGRMIAAIVPLTAAGWGREIDENLLVQRIAEALRAEQPSPDF